jgi:hypothetical protein
MKKLLLSSVAMVAFGGAAFAACPAVTVADPKGVPAGAFPQQYELGEFQRWPTARWKCRKTPTLPR